MTSVKHGAHTSARRNAIPPFSVVNGASLTLGRYLASGVAKSQRFLDAVNASLGTAFAKPGSVS